MAIIGWTSQFVARFDDPRSQVALGNGNSVPAAAPPILTAADRTAPLPSRLVTIRGRLEKLRENAHICRKKSLTDSLKFDFHATVATEPRLKPFVIEEAFYSFKSCSRGT
jgi:hypothetical protein